MSRQKQYWGFRVDVNNPDVYPDYYNTELKQERLRQGWGWKGTDLAILTKQSHETVPEELRDNFRMYNEVKKGDIILIPRIPKWEMLTIAEATEDWDTGYRFGNDQDKEGYGHQFPARCITYFNRHNKHVNENIRSTLHCQRRFWNMNRCSESINLLCNRASENLAAAIDG